MGVLSPAVGSDATTGADESEAEHAVAVAVSPSAAEGLHHPTRAELDLTAVLHALSDPMRLKIVAALADGRECSCRSIDLPVVKSTCTHHFRVLREAGVIRQRLESTAKLNSLRCEDLDARWPGLLDAVLGGLAE